MNNRVQTMFLMALILLAPHLSEMHAKVWALVNIFFALVLIAIDRWESK